MEADAERKRILSQAMSELYDDFDNDTFVSIPEGRGGTLAFGSKSEGLGDATHYAQKPTRVGTFWCITCVGLYLQVDRKRCLMAHVNAWSSYHPAELLNYVDPDGGLEIREQVLKRLQHEYSSRGWDRRDDSFADLVVVCSQRVQALVDGDQVLKESIKLTGCYVFLGIGDFLRSEAAELAKDSRNAWDRAKMLLGSSSEARLQDQIDNALRAATQANDSRRVNEVHEAASEAVESTKLRRKAKKLSKTAEELTFLKAHGFVVDQENGKAVLSHIMRTKEGDQSRALASRLPTDIDKYMPLTAADHETENWTFSTQKDLDELLKEAKAKPQGAELASVLEEQSVLAKSAAKVEKEPRIKDVAGTNSAFEE